MLMSRTQTSMKAARMKAYQAQYYARHRERIATRRRANRLAHRAEHIATVSPPDMDAADVAALREHPAVVRAMHEAARSEQAQRKKNRMAIQAAFTRAARLMKRGS